MILGMLMLVSTLVAQAGEKGNGGDAVVCRDKNGEIISVELLDYYEGRVMRKLSSLEYPELSDDEFLDRIGGKLQLLEESLDYYNLREAKELLQAVRDHIQSGQNNNPEILFTDDKLTDIPDSNELIIKNGCGIEQLAIWKNKEFPEDPLFIIQSELVKKLSPKDIRGLVLHESIYKFLWLRNALSGQDLTNSIPVRYLHQKLMSRPLEKMTFTAYLEFLMQMAGDDSNVKYFNHGRGFSVRNARIYPDRIEVNEKDSDVTYALDTNGAISKELTMRYGRLNWNSYFTLPDNNVSYGSAAVSTLKVDFKRNQEAEWSTFGEQELTVSLNKSNGETSNLGEWGVSYKTGKETQTVFIKAKQQKKEKTYKKKFFIGLDEWFKVVITEKL